MSSAFSDVSALSPKWRHALVARLLRSIAMAYGVGTDFGRDEIGQVDPDWSGAATPLRALLAAIAGDKQATQDTSAADIENWEGDWETLRSHEDRLCAEPDLCDRVFASKHEAFTAAYALATANTIPTPVQGARAQTRWSGRERRPEAYSARSTSPSVSISTRSLRSSSRTRSVAVSTFFRITTRSMRTTSFVITSRSS